MRGCPRCGASNPAAAEWCGQCLARFTPPPPPPALRGVPTTGLLLGSRGAFKVTEEGILWACTRCGTENPLEHQTCRACGALFSETLRPAPEERPQRDPGTAALVSLFMPGAGHAYLGLWGQAFARAVVSLWVVITTLLGAIQQVTFLAVTFGIASVGLWVAAAHDAYQEARGAPDAVLLKGRSFMYLVLGLLGLLFVMLVGAALQARG